MSRSKDSELQQILAVLKDIRSLLMVDIKVPSIVEDITVDYGDDFNSALSLVLENERAIGSVGVSQQEYNRFRKRHGKTILDIEFIEPDEVAKILYHDKWIKTRCHELNRAYQYDVFDSAVNSGVINAIKQIKAALREHGFDNVGADGDFDSATMEALKDINLAEGFLFLFRKERWNYYLKIPRLKNILHKLKERVCPQ